MSVDERIRAGLARTTAELPEPDTVQALGAVTAASRADRRRRRWAWAAAGAAAVAVVTAGVVVTVHIEDDARSVSPADEAPSPSVPATTDGLRPYFLDLRTGEVAAAGNGLVSQDMLNPWYLFSPDGSRVAYNTCSEGSCPGADELRVANADGTDTRVLDDSGDRTYATAWSPDGTKLLYMSGDNLYIRDFASGTTTRLFEPESTGWFANPYTEYGPNDADFSPDGRTVVFSRPRTASEDAAWDVWTVPATGGEPTLLLRNGAHPQYLADGQQVAFIPPLTEQQRDEPQPIVIASATGSRRTLVETEGEMWNIAISPDRTKILYNNGTGSHVVDVETGEDTAVPDAERSRWAGDDTLFVERGADD